MNHGLTSATMNAITNCLRACPHIRKCTMYGSRAMGTHRPGSDIDLVVEGEHLKMEDIYKLEVCIDDLLLPYKFDIAILDHISNINLLDHIHRVGTVIFQREEPVGETFGK